MPKTNSSYVKICESSRKVLTEFPELGLKKNLVRSVLVEIEPILLESILLESILE